MDCPHCQKPLPENAAAVEKEWDGYRVRYEAATPEDVVRLMAACDEIREKWAAGTAELKSAIVTKTAESVRYEMLDPVTRRWVPCVPRDDADTPHVVGGK